MYKLRRAAEAEASAAMGLIDQAKAFLKAQGIDQWQKGYPDLACICGDLNKGKGYFMADESGEIAAYMCIDFDGEPAYNDLNGAWLTESGARYAVVHRMAMDHGSRGRGLATRAFALVEELCRERGVGSIRIDTDADNAIMKHILDKNGFTYCGLIRFDNSDKIAYEKILGKQACAAPHK